MDEVIPNVIFKTPKASGINRRSRQTVAEPVLKSDRIGPFWFEQSHNVIVNGRSAHKGITSREHQQLKELIKTEIFTYDMLKKHVVPLNNENSSAPRLRAYDWAVTNYSKGNPKVILKVSKDGNSSFIDPNLSYEGQLRKHHRLLFDPFRRGTHVFFEIDGEIHRSTVGQLTFIKWCVENGVDKYVQENLAVIRTHMSQATRKVPGARKRRELTAAPNSLVRGVMMSEYEVVTDTAKEVEACKEGNKKAMAVELAMCEDEESKLNKAKKLLSII